MTHAVVIVDWNGADDTIACLDSFLAGSAGACAIVVDNGSTDGSPARIAAWLETHGFTPVRVGRAEATSFDSTQLLGRRAVIVSAGENLGFAAGCNLGLAVAARAGVARTVFLNNDTVVEPGALDRIVARLSANDCWACLPMLVVHATDRIWNCGGSVWRAGFRTYRHAGEPRAAVAATPEIRCSFFTGCCFAVDTTAFAARGGFSERFFFGEEDFELALWLKDRGLDAVCLTSAVVRHKVSASFDRAAEAGAGRAAAGKASIYYLNRFIHMRLRFGRARWALWAAAYLPYATALLVSRGLLAARAVPGFAARLWRRAWTMDRVTRADFEAVLRAGGP